MKKNFNISINKRISFNLLISGFSKFYRWIFNNIIKINFIIEPYTPRITQRFNVSNTLKTTQAIKQYSPSLKERFVNTNNIIKITQKFSIRSLENLDFISNIIISQSVKYIRDFTRFMSINLGTIKMNMTSKITVAIFYKLRDWDYKIPDQPETSPKYVLSELDSYTLGKMDVRQNIS